MRTAIMQPYFLPYVGYFQLIDSVDIFILYDNIKYTKKGWINRNRFLLNGKDVMFSLPLKRAADHLDIRERELSDDFNCDKLLNQFRGAYGQAPYFRQAFPVIEQIVREKESNLFNFLHRSIVRVCSKLGIATRIRISSDVAIDHNLKGQDKVLALCKAVGTDVYINAIGGMDLYSKQDFQAHGIELKFIRSRPFVYAQLGNEFVPWLSIVDPLMFNPLERVQDCIRSNYDLV